MVLNPSHYCAGDIECLDAIQAMLTPEEFRGFVKGNVVKYAWRERLKGGDQDLRKAANYLRLLLDSLPSLDVLEGDSEYDAAAQVREAVDLRIRRPDEE